MRPLGVEVAFLGLQNLDAGNDASRSDVLVFSGRRLHCANGGCAESTQVLQLVAVLLERMPGDKESKNLFFSSQTRVFIPVGSVGEPVIVRLGFFLLKNSKQAVLAGFGVALGFSGTVDGFIEDRHQLRAAAE